MLPPTPPPSPYPFPLYPPTTHPSPYPQPLPRASHLPHYTPPPILQEADSNPQKRSRGKGSREKKKKKNGGGLWNLRKEGRGKQQLCWLLLRRETFGERKRGNLSAREGERNNDSLRFVVLRFFIHQRVPLNPSYRASSVEFNQTIHRRKKEKMAEEHSLEAPEGHRLCANNCGFFGSPATQNFCSKCYRDLRREEEQASSAKFAVEKSLAASASSSSSSPSSSASASLATAAPPSPPALTLAAAATTEDRWTPQTISVTAAVPSLSDQLAAPPKTVSQPNRCSTCRKRVGLTGFKCRCGTTFCGAHRYPEQHGCTFDFKSLGREAIAKANPVVKAEKLEKI